MHSCEIVSQSTCPAMTIRTRSAVQDLPMVIGQSYASIARYLQDAGASPSGPPFVIYYNMDMQNLDVEIGFPVARMLPDHGDIHASELPGGDMGVCLHTGPYDTMCGTYEALNRFIGEQGRTAIGTAIEEYLNAPGETPPEKLLTRIILPLRNR